MADKGFDISYHNGSINFKKAKADGIKFAILREGYRKTIDTKFIEYVNGAKEAGIDIHGVYHFFYPLKEADVIEEAKSCIANVQKAGLGKDIIIFADFEYDTFSNAKRKGTSLSKSVVTPWTILFCDYCRSQGYKVGVYTNQDYYQHYYDMSKIKEKEYIIWLADYSGGPNYPCTYQQYTSSGKCAGVNSSGLDMNYYFGEPVKTTPVTECDTSQRQAVVDAFESWKGYSESNGKHKTIVDIYNAYLATAVKVNSTCNYRVSYTDAWCATANSAAYIKAGLADFFPIECSCPRMVENAKKMGIWKEADGYIPEPADSVLYDWQDGTNYASTDNTGTPDHIGMIVSVNKDAGTMLVIEGNKNDAVEYRTLNINGRYIRGFIHPEISGTVSSKTVTSASAPSKDVAWIGKVTASSLRVRTWAGTENGTCSFSPLKKGTEVYVCDTVKDKSGDDWYYIKHNGKYGFVHSAYIKKV